MPVIPLIDYLVLGWFLACWMGYTVFSAAKSRRKPSLLVAMRHYRYRWFERMLGHEVRIAHVAALNSLQSGATFFASTSLLILGGLVAMLGTTERVMGVVADVPFVRHESEAVWMIKIVLLIAIFMYAFFKFTWAIRQFNFCAVLIGAAPHTDAPQQQEAFLSTITGIASFAAENFNLGLRAFYFALAVLTWFLHPWLFVIASALVVHVLHQREFKSRTLQVLLQPDMPLTPFQETLPRV